MFDLTEHVTKLIHSHNIAIEELTTKQLVEAFTQALAAGDFQRLVTADRSSQQVIYIPFARQQQLEAEIAVLKDQLNEYQN